MFFHTEAHFLLYSERVHFFRRFRIKGIRHIIFYQPPTYPHFYSEMCNLMQVTIVLNLLFWDFFGRKDMWNLVISVEFDELHIICNLNEFFSKRVSCKIIFINSTYIDLIAGRWWLTRLVICRSPTRISTAAASATWRWRCCTAAGTWSARPACWAPRASPPPCTPRATRTCTWPAPATNATSRWIGIYWTSSARRTDHIFSIRSCVACV